MTLSAVPDLRVFKRGNESKIINWLLDRGFSPSYDAKNITIQWNGEHRFYQYTEGKFIESESFGSDLLIGFNDGIKVESWEDILAWLNSSGGEQYDRADKVLERTKFEKPISGDLPNSVPPQMVEPSGEYSFRCEPFLGGFLYEVVKPNTDRPYTVYEEKWVDHINFFSSLFVCDSWGVSRQDLQFLHSAWKNLGMPGCLDLEGLVQKRVYECEHGAPEPKVYRKSLIDVKTRLVESETIVGGKRKAVQDEVSHKK